MPLEKEWLAKMYSRIGTYEGYNRITEMALPAIGDPVLGQDYSVRVFGSQSLPPIFSQLRGGYGVYYHMGNPNSSFGGFMRLPNVGGLFGWTPFGGSSVGSSYGSTGGGLGRTAAIVGDIAGDALNPDIDGIFKQGEARSDRDLAAQKAKREEKNASKRQDGEGLEAPKDPAGRALGYYDGAKKGLGAGKIYPDYISGLGKPRKGETQADKEDRRAEKDREMFLHGFGKYLGKKLKEGDTKKYQDLFMKKADEDLSPEEKLRALIDPNADSLEEVGQAAGGLPLPSGWSRSNTGPEIFEQFVEALKKEYPDNWDRIADQLFAAQRDSIEDSGWRSTPYRVDDAIDSLVEDKHFTEDEAAAIADSGVFDDVRDKYDAEKALKKVPRVRTEEGGDIDLKSGFAKWWIESVKGIEDEGEMNKAYNYALKKGGDKDLEIFMDRVDYWIDNKDDIKAEEEAKAKRSVPARPPAPAVPTPVPASEPAPDPAPDPNRQAFNSWARGRIDSGDIDHDGSGLTDTGTLRVKLAKADYDSAVLNELESLKNNNPLVNKVIVTTVAGFENEI